jgi:putative copper export protein
VLAMITLAALNRFIRLPRIRIGAHKYNALPMLIRNVFLEQSLGLLVLAAAAILGLLPPPIVVAPR